MSAPEASVTVRLYAPIPSVPAEGHGGLKLDAESEVGRSGVLLEWELAVPPVDAGVPAAVAGMLAAGLCAATTVAGCTLDLPRDVGPAWRAVPGGHGCRFPGRGWRRSRDEIGVLASADPAVVARLFDDGDFLWAHESQLLVLSAPGALPALDRETVDACFDVPMRVDRARLAAAGIVGLVRAGVDGDVAGLYLPEPAWRAAVLHALADAVRRGGGRWEAHDGAEHPAMRLASTRAAATTSSRTGRS